MQTVTKKKKMSKTRILFILFGITLPIIQWLIFYVYTNFEAVLMAFRGSDGGFSFENFVRFYEELKMPTSHLRIAIRNTFITFAIILVSYPFKVLVSYFIYKKVPFYGFYRVVFFLPGIVFSVAWALIFTQVIGVDGAIAKTIQEWLNLDYTPELLADSKYANTVVLLHMIWMGFPGDLIIWGGTFARIPEEVLESGKIDGVTWWTEFTQIIVPMVWPTVGLQMVLMFCNIFGSTGAVFLLTKGMYGTMTINSWLYLSVYNSTGNKFTSNVFNYMSAIGLILTTLSITISLIVRKISDKMFEEVEY